MPVITPAVLLAFTCLLPAAAGALHYKQMDKSFHPFIWAMFLSVFTEGITTFRNANGWPLFIHYLTGNFYFALNLLFYLLFFYRQKAIRFTGLKVLLIFCGLALIMSSFVRPPWEVRMLELWALYVIIIFFISGKLVSEQIFSVAVPLFKNALFIICCGALLWVFYFLFLILRSFRINISFILRIMQYANALSYLVFFWGVLCIPKKSIFFKNLTPVSAAL